MCVQGKRLQVAEIRGQNRSAGFRNRDYERIDSGSSTSQPSQQCRPTRERLRDFLHDVTGLEKGVRARVATRMTPQAFDQNDRRDHGRPQVLLSKRKDHSDRLPRALGQAAYTARIEDQHDGQPALRVDRRASRAATAPARARWSADGSPTSAIRSAT